MEYVTCNLCGTNGNYVVLSERGRFGLNVRNVICKKCGLVYQNPRHSYEILRLEYKFSSYHARYKGAEIPSVERAKTEYYYCRCYIDFLSRYRDLSICGSILDVGCSTGGVLHRMSELGWKTLGVEPSHNYAELARTYYGLNVIEGLLEDIQLPHATFDVIIATHLLEHLHNPIDSLKRLHSSLKDNGLLLISTPNILKPLGWYNDLFHDVHLFMFSSNTLSLMLSSAGFYILDYNCQDGHINMIAKKGVYIFNPTRNVVLPADNWKVICRKLCWYRRFDWLFVFFQKLMKKAHFFSLPQFIKSCILKFPGGSFLLCGIHHLLSKKNNDFDNA